MEYNFMDSFEERIKKTEEGKTKAEADKTLAWERSMAWRGLLFFVVFTVISNILFAMELSSSQLNVIVPAFAILILIAVKVVFRDLWQKTRDLWVQFRNKKN